LKLGLPHLEGEHEIAGLHFWAGTPTVQLLEADEEHNAMLLERCQPGTSLRALPEQEQDAVLAPLLRRLWRVPPEFHPFRPLSTMLAYWSQEAWTRAEHWSDPGLVKEGLHLFQELAETAPEQVLLATDLHAGNVLQAQREPWLAIDPKPFVGDPAYDATQHLLNCQDRLRSEPKETIRRWADLLQLETERVRLWTFARIAVQAGNSWREERWRELARVLGQ
jgi:streptomycin 6-kinase